LVRLLTKDFYNRLHDLLNFLKVDSSFSKQFEVQNSHLLQWLLKISGAKSTYISLFDTEDEIILHSIGLPTSAVKLDSSFAYQSACDVSLGESKSRINYFETPKTIAGLESIKVSTVLVSPLFSVENKLIGAVSLINFPVSNNLINELESIENIAQMIATNFDLHFEHMLKVQYKSKFDEVFNYTTPYFIILSQQFQVLDLGQNFSKLSFPIHVGDNFNDLFNWSNNVDADKFFSTNEYAKKLLFFTSKDQKLKFKCAVRLMNQNEIIILAMPVINQQYSIANYNVSLSDFAHHDYVSEFIFLNESFEKGLQDSLKLNQILKSKNKELETSKQLLINTNQVLEERVHERTKEIKNLALFPQQNPNPVVEVNYVSSKISYMNPSAISLIGNKENTEFKTLLEMLDVDDLSIISKSTYKKEVTIHERIFEKSTFFLDDNASVRFYLHDITEIRTKEKLEKLKYAKFLKQQNALLEMRCLPIEMSMEDKLAFILRKTSEVLDTFRSSVWFFNHEKDALILNYSFSASQHFLEKGKMFRKADFPTYFQSISSENIIHFEEIQNHPIGKEFNSKVSLGKSILDVSLLQANNSFGVLSNEYNHAAFNMEEISFARSVADVIILVIENNKLKQSQIEIINKNYELEKAMSKLVSMQDEIINQEKMATLGMLIAGIAHEINTPLGAIKASNENTLKTLNLIFNQGVEKYSKEFIQNTFELLSHCRIEAVFRSTREERQIIKQIELELNENFADISNTNFFARRLTELGFDKVDTRLAKYLKLQDREAIFLFVGELHLLLRSSRTISIASEKATKVVKALNTFSHGNIENEIISFNLLENIESVVTLFQNKIKHHVTLKMNIDKSVMVTGNQEQLAQVWSNIINNALQASTGQCSIWIDHISSNNSDIVTIANDGPAIPEDSITKIFDAFYSTKKRGQGTGLGLNIVKKIVESHKGTIECTSDQSKTVFKITLPKFNNM
jgi:two-component system, NtrC family, sensor kinase